MKLHSPNPSPDQQATLDGFFAGNLCAGTGSPKTSLEQRTPAEVAAYEQQVDALPTPPTWYRAPLMSDPTQLYEAFSTLTAEQIKENVDLLLSRHVKQWYQNDLAAAGSGEELKANSRQAHAEHEQQRQKRCQAAGVDFEPDPFE